MFELDPPDNQGHLKAPQGFLAQRFQRNHRPRISPAVGAAAGLLQWEEAEDVEEAARPARQEPSLSQPTSLLIYRAAKCPDTRYIAHRPSRLFPEKPSFLSRLEWDWVLEQYHHPYHPCAWLKNQEPRHLPLLQRKLPFLPCKQKPRQSS